MKNVRSSNLSQTKIDFINVNQVSFSRKFRELLQENYGFKISHHNIDVKKKQSDVNIEGKFIDKARNLTLINFNIVFLYHGSGSKNIKILLKNLTLIEICKNFDTNLYNTMVNNILQAANHKFHTKICNLIVTF